MEIIVEKVRKFVVTDGEARDEVERLYGLDAFYEAPRKRRWRRRRNSKFRLAR